MNNFIHWEAQPEFSSRALVLVYQVIILVVKSDLGGGFRSLLTWTTSQFAYAPFFSLHLLLTHQTFFLGLSSVAGEQQCNWSAKGCVELLQWSHWQLAEHRRQLLPWPGGLFSYLQGDAIVADFSWSETQLGIQSLFALDTVCAVHFSSAGWFFYSQLIYKLLWHRSS